MITLSDFREEDARSTAFDSILGWLGTETLGARAIWPFKSMGINLPGGKGLLETWARHSMGQTRTAIPKGQALSKLASAYFSKAHTVENLGGSSALADYYRSKRTAQQAQWLSKLAGKRAVAPIAAGIKDLGSAVKLFRFGFGVSFGLTLAKGAVEWASSINTISAEPFQGRSAPGAAPIYFGGAAYTQRQRALSAIHNSQLTTRAIFGNEAAYVH